MFKQYPPQEDVQRLINYDKYENLFLGNHKTVFNQKLKEHGTEFLRDNPIRYVVLNYPKIISTISADMLFQEKPVIKTENNDKFVEALIEDNNLWTLFYELALSTSYKGDGIIRIRNQENNVKIEVIKPDVYFVDYNKSNLNTKPERQVLAYIVDLKNDTKGLLVESYYSDRIETELYEYTKNVIGNRLNLKEYDPELQDIVYTGLTGNFALLHHLKNYGTTGNYWGISDYTDLEDLFFAINNRFSRNETILDKHTDPILAVPEGFLNDKGEVNKGEMGVVEIPQPPIEGGSSPIIPQYITWDAGMQSSFEQINTLIDQMFVIAKISHSLIGNDKGGVADSGRALKYRMIPTIALRDRKLLYWDYIIKNVIESTMAFCLVNRLSSKGVFPVGIETPKITWKDGILDDELESISNEEKKLANGLTTKEEAIAKIDGISSNDAKEKLIRIQEELKAQAMANPFSLESREIYTGEDN
jgi:hypothetical protein